MNRLLIAAAAVAATALSPAATAVAAPGATLTPNKAGKASRLHVELDAAAADFGGRFPDAVVADIQKGFKLDPKAVATTCSDAAANSVSCPAAARIASGSAVISAGAFGTYTAKVEGFLAQTKQAGDLAGVILQITEPQTQIKKSVRGRVVVGGGEFGYQIRFEQLTAALPPLPPGVTLQLQSLAFDVGANRTVKKKVKKKVNGKRRTVTVKKKYSLITNPKTCTAAGWKARVTARFTDGSQVVRDYTVTCTA